MRFKKIQTNFWYFNQRLTIRRYHKISDIHIFTISICIELFKYLAGNRDYGIFLRKISTNKPIRLSEIIFSYHFIFSKYNPRRILIYHAL